MTALRQNQSILKHTQEELSKSTSALEKQNEYISKQGFEGTYFELLKILKDIVDSNNLDVELYEEMNRKVGYVFSTPAASKGSLMLKTINAQFHDILRRETNINPNIKIRNNLNKNYRVFYETYETQIGSYFRFLSEIFSFVLNSEVVDKKLYFNFLRSRTSDIELLIIFYYSISEFGKELSPLILEYDFLRDLNTNNLFDDDVRLIFNETFKK